MASFQERVIGAMQARPATFEEVEHDATATSQAAVVVIAVSIARGLGYWTTYGSLTWVIYGTISALIGWVIFAFMLWAIGTKVMPGRNTEADLGQLLRTSGFAQAAGVLGILGILPLIGGLISLIVSLWVLYVVVIAVRQALDYEDTLRAVIVCVIAAVAGVIAMMAVSLLFGGAMLGAGGMHVGL